MRDLILKMSLSIDGFASDPDGQNKWMFGTDHEAKAWSSEYLWSAGLHIMGSNTFRSMAAWWPAANDQFAPPMNHIPKAVFSRQWSSVPGDLPIGLSPELQPGAMSWKEAYVAHGDLADEIAHLKAQEGKPVIAHGGVSFARSLIARRLVDQFTLLVLPVALGKGKSLFSDLDTPMPLTLVSSKAFPGGAVAQIYRPS